MPVTDAYRPSTAWSDLGDGFADAVRPARFPRTELRWRNQRAASQIGLDELTDEEWLAHLARFEPLPGAQALPLAQRYHGHQFGGYNPDLGDGRGFTFAQLHDDRGRLMELTTKGSGTTPYSRGGDGRLTLQGGVRELLATELLEALGVPTSRTLSLVETGESLYRHDEQSPTRGCVLVRLSHGQIRFGTFQRHAYHRDHKRLRQLLAYCIAQWDPDLAGAAPSAWLARVTERQARLCAGWMVAGFVHGVLNTDNLNPNGESFDYGPWRFLPGLDLDHVAAYFDHAGRYAYRRQPDAIWWGLQQLAVALEPLDDDQALLDAVRPFQQHYEQARTARFLARLGVTPLGGAADVALQRLCFGWLAKRLVPYAQFFRDWYGGAAGWQRALEGPRAAAYRMPAFAPVEAALSAYAPRHPDRLGHPALEDDAPGLVIEEVRALWKPIAEHDDWQPLMDEVARIRRWGSLLR